MIAHYTATPTNTAIQPTSLLQSINQTQTNAVVMVWVGIYILISSSSFSVYIKNREFVLINIKNKKTPKSKRPCLQNKTEQGSERRSQDRALLCCDVIENINK